MLAGLGSKCAQAQVPIMKEELNPFENEFDYEMADELINTFGFLTSELEDA